MKDMYIDLHTHTDHSDGLHSPRELCRRAQEAGVGILAITDHNVATDPDPLVPLFPGLKLIRGVEFSCMYAQPTGAEVETHIVALGFDPAHQGFLDLVARNHLDRASYIGGILEKLRLHGMELGTYEDLQKRHPGKAYIGRRDVAQLMKDLGYVETVDEAYDVYIGAFGQRKAYVPKPKGYASLEEVVGTIRAAGGVAVLAHLYYFPVEDPEGLVRRFKALGGQAMEVYYSTYDEAQTRSLKALADKYGLMYSAASDYHGQGERDSLKTGFTADSCRELLAALGCGC